MEEEILAVQQVVHAERGIPVLVHELDADPWALNVANGTLNLKTGELREHDQKDLCTKLAPAAYLADADCLRWPRPLTGLP